MVIIIICANIIIRIVIISSDVMYMYIMYHRTKIIIVNSHDNGQIE